MGWRDSESIEQQWFDLGRRLGEPLSTSVTPCMRDPKCSQDCKHHCGRGTAVIHEKYRSSEVNKSIAPSIIDRNAPQ